MILLTVQDIRKHYGPEPVLDGVTFDVRQGERVSIVGPNGTGKTTLLKILAGREDPDGGQRQLHPSATVGYLEQQPEFMAGRTVWQEALRRAAGTGGPGSGGRGTGPPPGGSGPTTRSEKGWASGSTICNTNCSAATRIILDHKIEQVLVGLGFTAGYVPAGRDLLSGGQQNRLLLAKLLLQDPDMLLLDEPSNHLDLQATRWLEDYLVDTSQTLLVVSHDRYFLDKVTNRTLELYQGTIDQYSGNFSAYQRQKAERLEVQRRTFDKQQTEIAKMEDFVRRNHYGQKHAQAEDRRKKLERIERVDAPREITAPPMSFPSAARSGDIVLRVEHLSKSYDKPLFTDLSLDMLRGEKWAVLGPNGCGKTTLIRCLLGQTAARRGRVVIWAAGVKIAYFDQLLQCLDPAQMVVDAIRPDHKEFVEGQRRELLARYGITGRHGVPAGR